MRRRSKQVAEAQPTDGMRSMWEFVYISQFLRFFQDKLDLVHFDVEELENAFQEAENYPLFSVFASLLRLLLARWDVRLTRWQDVLREELDKRNVDPNPLEDADYEDLAPEEKVLLLKYVIDYICDEDNDKFEDLKEFKTDFLNPESEITKPIGQDAQGYTYWYFDDLRLYREKTSKKADKKSWETVCTTSEEWDNIVRSLQRNKESEKNLHDYIQEELYPTIEPLLKEHEKERDVKSRKKKNKSNKTKKELSKEEERDALIKQEEELIAKMKQEEEMDKQRNMEHEHRKKGRRKREDVEQEACSPTQDSSDEQGMQTNEEQVELEKRIEEEIKKQESLISAEDIESGLIPRTRRKCVIVREQTKKKKEWWDEEGIGSDLDEEDDMDSDGSDGPRRRKKKAKLMKPVELPGQLNRTYVFSTALANRAAEAVQQGRVESIIAFHRAQHTTSPYLRPEKERTFDPSNKSYEQQKAYFSQQYHQQGSMMSRGFGGVPSMPPDGNPGPSGRPGYTPAQWQQLQLQQQYLKERQQRQHPSSQVDDLSQILFGGPANGNGQNPTEDAPFPRGSYPSRPGVPGQQGVQYSYPQRVSSQQQSYQEYRPPFPQGYTQQQQQQYFQRPRNLPQLHSPGAQSPSADPLGANVRSPPPPYPGGRSGETRPQHHVGNSPAAVPSPTSTGSPQTPLTPHTPRFPGAVPSPGEPAKPPFSPSNQQSTFTGTGGGSYSGSKQPSSESSGSDTAGEGRPGFIDLGSKGYQNAPSSQPQGYDGMGSFIQSPMDDRQRSEDTTKGPFNNHENSLQSPTQTQPHRPMASFESAPNKSPFLPTVSQGITHSPNAYSTASASMPKSFSVESLTAPSAPVNQPGHTPDQQMPPFSGIYYQSKFQPPAMFGGQRYQYPSTIQHSGAFYNSQLPSNVYLDRGSMPVYPPGRESGL